MQITIVQAEIERAIREYIGRQMKVADGMEMAMELQATRGAEGFKAVIDIRPITCAIPEAFKQTEALIRQQPFIGSTARTPEPGVVGDVAPFVAAAPTVVDSSSLDTVEGSSAPELTVDSSSASEAQPEAPPTNTRSLFKGLSKPKNN